MRERPRRTPSPTGSAPPESDVPAPRGTTFSLFAEQKRRTAQTSSADLRQDDRERLLAVGGQRVAVVGDERVVIGDDAVGHEAAQAVDQRGAPGEDARDRVPACA